MSSQKVFVTGATGYIDGSVAVKLVKKGYQVTGLVRSQSGAKRLKEAGIEPFKGTLDDYESLKQIVKEHDLVINAADSDHPYVVTTILSAIEGTGKKFVHTSGSSIVGDKAKGEFGDKIYHEETIDPKPEKLARAMIDQVILRAANRGVHTIMICPTLIYGKGLGNVNKDSIQVPNLIKLALKKGAASHIGKGENVWSNVHIKDLVDLYMLAIDRAPAGSFFFAENGEASMKEMAEAINRVWNLAKETQSISLDEAIREWGPEGAHFAFGSNSRVRATKARQWLAPDLSHHTSGCLTTDLSNDDLNERGVSFHLVQCNRDNMTLLGLKKLATIQIRPKLRTLKFMYSYICSGCLILTTSGVSSRVSRRCNQKSTEIYVNFRIPNNTLPFLRIFHYSVRVIQPFCMYRSLVTLHP